jgi:hypothetical protein
MLTGIAKMFDPSHNSLESFEEQVPQQYPGIDVSKLLEEEQARLPRLAESEAWRLPGGLEVSRRLGRIHTLY